MRILDLSTAFDREFSTPQPPFVSERRLDEIRYTNTFEDSGFVDSELYLSTHAGTHVEAPMMVFARGEKEGRYFLEDFPIDELYAWTAVLDVQKGPLEPITADDLEAASKDVTVESGDFILVHTGWGRYFEQERKHGRYLWENHPGLDPSGAEWVVSKEARGYGQDTMSVQCAKYPLLITEEQQREGQTRPDHAVHKALLGNDILCICQLTNLDQVANQRLVCGYFPLPFRELEASPIRAVAFLDG